VRSTGREGKPRKARNKWHPEGAVPKSVSSKKRKKKEKAIPLA
jgi:hypothetical protein